MNVVLLTAEVKMAFVKSTHKPKTPLITLPGPGLASAKTKGGSVKIQAPNPRAKIDLGKRK